MYAMRPATPGDRPAITELVVAGGCRDNRTDTSMIDRDRHATPPAAPEMTADSWCGCCTHDLQVLGCTVLHDALQDYGSVARARARLSCPSSAGHG